MAFTTVRSATGVDFIGTPGVDVGTFFDETGMVVATGLGDADIITTINSTGIQRTTTLNGGDGADTINVSSSISDSSINGNKGADTIQLSSVVANSFVGGGDGADIIGGGGQWLSSLFHGGAGNDTIFTANTLALTTVLGYSGNDVIYLNSGSFNSVSINGNEGDDSINGNAISVNLTGTNFIGGGAGNDVLNFISATTDGGGPALSKGFELVGGSGNDLINGSTENDIIWGNADNDTLQGNQGRDTIYAGAGKDTINVTDSGDVITGGTGGDIYFKPGAASSTFLINSIAESAAAITGTAAGGTANLTFDSFTGYAFAAGDVLNIAAVTNQLAGSPYIGSSTTAAMVLPGGGVLGAIADFATLKTTLDSLVGVLASDNFNIRAYNFTAAIGPAGTPVANYTWIQDSLTAYSSSDLLFQTAGGFFNGGQISLV